LDDLELRISKAARNVVPTPWPCINDIMDGGLGAGELGCILAPSGAGKSWFLAAIGAAAMMQGKKVIHYTFELSETYLGLRYDTIFTGIEPNKIRNHPDKVREAMAKINGQLIIKYFPARSVTINALRAHMERQKSLGIEPELVIIDYADLMNSAGKADDKTHMQTLVHEEIRGMCGEYKIPGWTASQTQRTAIGDDEIGAEKIGGSYGKVQTDDFVMSVSRKVADKQNSTARSHIIKNRLGPDGMTFPTIADLEHGEIEVFDENTPEGAKVKQMMQDGEKDVKKLLNQKFLDLQKKNPNMPDPA
jgi:replicative DNA helicase